MGKIEDLMAAGRLIATRKMPYFRSGFMSLVPTEAPGLGTVGVTKGLLFLYDPQWLDGISQEEMAALTYHEFMHTLLQHLDRRGDKDPGIWNKAGDLYINDQGRKAGFVFPKGDKAGLFPEMFKFPPNLTTDEYYALLLKQSEDDREKHNCKCGSGAGNPFKDEPGSDGKPADGERSEAEIGQLRQRIAEAVKKHAQQNGRGNIPLGLDRWADDALQAPKVPWQTVLARAVRNAVAYRPGAVDYSYKRISRRQGGIGFGVGVPVLPAFVRPVPRVTFVLDTSGSMSQDQLAAGLSECAAVLQAVGAEVTFISCDHAVHALGKVSNPSQLAKLVKGGGGSSFVPAFEVLAQPRNRTELAIFATDGMIGVPPNPPPFMRVIWLLIGVEVPPTEAYGDVIKVIEQ